MKVKELEKSGLEAIKSLRKSKLQSGLPFMINSQTLPSDQCYMEYPNGSIMLVTLCRKKNDFEIIAQCSAKEIALIRKKNNLL